MNELQDLLLNTMATLPDWIFWAILVVVAVLVIVFYFFPKHVRKVTDKYDIPYEKVDGMVKMMASLAVRLYVLKKGVEEKEKMEHIKGVAMTIDVLYPTTSSIRLSQLVLEIEKETNKKFKGSELEERKKVVADIRDNILAELVVVGEHIHDNEKDPIVDPREITRWINKGISSVNYVNR